MGISAMQNWFQSYAPNISRIILSILLLKVMLTGQLTARRSSYKPILSVHLFSCRNHWNIIQLWRGKKVNVSGFIIFRRMRFLEVWVNRDFSRKKPLMIQVPPIPHQKLLQITLSVHGIEHLTFRYWFLTAQIIMDHTTPLLYHLKTRE